MILMKTAKPSMLQVWIAAHTGIVMSALRNGLKIKRVLVPSAKK
jgi:hypothetical protein